MNWDKLDSIDWDSYEATAEWIKILNDLLGLIDSADSKEKRDKLASKLDEFADHSTSMDLQTITELDSSARKAARGLRNKNIDDGIKELAAASANYKDAVKAFSAATAGLKKEASLLRAEKFTAAVSALTGTISSLKTLAEEVGDDTNLANAIADAVKHVQKLRGVLEKPA